MMLMVSLLKIRQTAKIRRSQTVAYGISYDVVHIRHAIVGRLAVTHANRQ